jgi:integrase
VKLALNIGIPQGELLRLERKWVNFERSTISVLQTKTMRWKTISINADALEGLNWLQANLIPR